MYLSYNIIYPSYSTNKGYRARQSEFCVNVLTSSCERVFVC